jgi:hypothetical protein
MTNLSFRRRSRLSFLLKLLLLCSLQSIVNGVDLKNLWDISDTTGKKCLAEDDVDILRTDSAVNGTSCDDSSSVIRLDYTIHKNAKYPKYKIFQKECDEEFEAGTEPMRGIMSPDEDNMIALSVSPASDVDETVTASLELRVTNDSLSSSWWRRLSNTEEQQKTIEFCVRMGLWLPPAAGRMEVNFRETNVAVTFNKKANSEHDSYAVHSVALEPKELIGVLVHVGSAATQVTTVKDEKDEDEKDTAEDTSEEKKDEL